MSLLFDVTVVTVAKQNTITRVFFKLVSNIIQLNPFMAM